MVAAETGRGVADQSVATTSPRY